MGDFFGQVSGDRHDSLLDSISKLVDGLQPDPTTSAGNFVSNGSFGSKKTITYAGFTTLASGATVALDPTLSNMFHYRVPGATSINASSVVTGEPLYIKLAILTSGVSMAVTFGTNFVTTATLNTGTAPTSKQYIMQFISDGLNYLEVSRTVAE